MKLLHQTPSTVVCESETISPHRDLPARKQGPRVQQFLLCLLLLALLTSCQFEDGLKSIPLIGDIYRLPDIDQRFTDIPGVNIFIKHRSILTHNALVPLAVAWLCRPLNKLGMVIALVPGSLFALHFLLDLFPKKWFGHAFIHLPVLGWLDWIPFDNNWIPTLFSISWLTLNMLLSQFSFLLIHFSRGSTRAL